MSGEIVVFVVIGIIMVALALGVWLLDARRNEEVEHDPERLDTDTDTGDAVVDPTDPLHRRH